MRSRLSFFRTTVPPALALCCVLAGCAVGPNYHRPTAPVPTAFKENAGWKPATPGEIEPNKPWWSIYNDPLLDALERQVEVSNQTLKADEAAYRAAMEAIAVDRGALFPSITATGSYTRSGSGSAGLSQAITTASGAAVTPSSGSNARTAATTRNIYSVGAQANWSIDVWGRIRRLIESDVARAQASAADVAAARLSAQVALASDYFQLRAADEQARLYKMDIEDFQNALNITQNQVKAGITTMADV